jgi:hypothetical protein
MMKEQPADHCKDFKPLAGAVEMFLALASLLDESTEVTQKIS